ncbi:hypothetical protein [Ruminococcus sp.]
MENKRSSVSYGEAYRIYTGRSFTSSIVVISIGAVAFFAGIMLFMALLMLADNDDTDLRSKSFFSITLAAVYCNMLIMTRMLYSFDKGAPGGKYFRTVKGGFDTFAKAQKAFIAEGAVVVFAFCAFLALLGGLGIIDIGNAVGSCLMLFITVFLARAIASFGRLIKKPVTRTIVIMFLLYIVNIFGIMLIESSGGKIGVLQIVPAAAAVVLTVISEALVLSDYRKTRWDN